MKSNFKIFLTFGLLICLTSPLYVEINQQPFCFSIPANSGHQYHLFYASITEESTLISQIQGTHLNNTQLQGSSNKITFNASQQIKICFRTKNKKMESVVIDFYTQQQSKFKQLALKDQVSNVHQQIIEVANKLKETIHLQQFEQQKQIIQSQIIEDCQNIITTLGACKIFLVAILILAQFLYLWKNIKPLAQSSSNSCDSQQ